MIAAFLTILGCIWTHDRQSSFTMTMHMLTPENGVAKSAQADSIVLEVVMRNDSDRTLLILGGNQAQDYSIDIRDQSSSHPADTEYGLKLKKEATSPSNFIFRNISLRLKPGETGTDVIPIGAMYDLRAGRVAQVSAINRNWGCPASGGFPEAGFSVPAPSFHHESAVSRVTACPTTVTHVIDNHSSNS